MRLKERERLLNVRPRCLIRVANTSDSRSVTATGKRYRAVDVMPTHAHTQGRSRRTGVQTLATGTAATGSEQHAGVTCASRRLCGCATSDMTSSNSSRRRGRKASSKKVAFERDASWNKSKVSRNGINHQDCPQPVQFATINRATDGIRQLRLTASPRDRLLARAFPGRAQGVHYSPVCP